MIYELMKREIGWSYMPVFVLVVWWFARAPPRSLNSALCRR